MSSTYGTAESSSGSGPTPFQDSTSLTATAPGTTTLGTTGTSYSSSGEIGSSSSRARQTMRFKVRFDSVGMTFDEHYPEELAPVLPPEEWEGVLRHLNTDLNQVVQQSMADLHAWTTGMYISCVFVVGVFVIPVVWVKKSRHQHAMEQFWKEVREFFTEINRKTFIRRGLEWKIVEDRRRMKKRDCYNPVYLYRVEVVWRKNVAKSRRELAREAAVARARGTTTTPSTSGSGGPSTTSTAAATKPRRRSKLRPTSNIESVQEVPPESEAAVADEGHAGKEAEAPGQDGAEASEKQGGLMLSDSD